MEKRTCPQCENHCSADALKCGKGAKYFGTQRQGSEIGMRHQERETGMRYQERESSSMTTEERILVHLRRCGHHLHHNAGHDTDAAALFDMLTAEEKASLEVILQKCLQRWQS